MFSTRETTQTPVSSTRDEAEAPPENGGVTPRVVLLCVALAFFFGFLSPTIDIKVGNTFLGATHLPPGAIGVLLALLLINWPLRVLAKHLAFSRNELLTVYVTCLFSCLVPGRGSENFFLSTSIAPFYYATPENKWLDFLLPNLKSWMTPALQNDVYNRALVDGWYTGLKPGEAIPWSAWLVPLAAWSALILASYVMLGCLSVMLRAQWAEREALTFPLLRLPLEMTRDAQTPVGGAIGESFFRDKGMWCGFGLVVFIQLLNGLNLYFPDVPRVPLTMDVGPFFTEAPWNQSGTLSPVLIYPIAVGITFLLTSEIAFSLWAFLWIIKFENIAAYAIGFPVNAMPNAIGANIGKIYTEYQRLGCYLVYVAIVLWTGREHFRHIVRRAFGRAVSTRDERREALSYPVAFWGFVLAFCFIVAWSVLAGVRLDLALAMWALYLVIAIALTRVVVEGGMLFVEQHWAPLGAMSQLFGSGPGTMISNANGLVPAAFLQGALMTDMRAFLMPSFVQSFKLAHDRKINAKPLLALISVCVLITLAMSLWMNVRAGYDKGCLTCDEWYARKGAQMPAQAIAELKNGAPDAHWTNWLWLALGGLLTFGMMAARARFAWFPLHPIGFLMCLTYPAFMLWFSIFLGWLCKVLITRFGGGELYRRAVPAFLGLVLGDVFMMLFWLCIDGWQGRTGHYLMPP